MDDKRKPEDISERGTAPAPIPWHTYVEDGLIILAIAALFFFTLHRDKTFGKIGLYVTLLSMVIILIRRIIRFRKAFVKQKEDKLEQ